MMVGKLVNHKNGLEFWAVLLPQSSSSKSRRLASNSVNVEQTGYIASFMFSSS